MAVKHRRQRRRVQRVATLGAATATVTALAVGTAPPPPAQAAAVQRAVDLQSGVSVFPDPQDIPDLTGGLGTAGYDLAQQIGAQVFTAIVENLNLVALAQAAGVDVDSIASGLLNDVANGVLDGALGAVPIDLTGILEPVLVGIVEPIVDQVLTDVLGGGVLGELLGDLAEPLVEALVDAVASQLGLNDIENLGDLVAILGLDLSDPFDLSGDPIPGLNIVTAGSPFTFLKLLGVDLGWAPPFPNSVAQDINDTEYLNIGLAGLLDAIDLGAVLGPILDVPIVGDLIDDVIDGLVDGLLGEIPDLAALRVPIVVGAQFGAFAAGAAYQQVVDDLPNQPGGADFTGTDPLLGSFTILPMILLDNPGRANGGMLARAYPLFRMLGIDTVTPETQVQSSGDGLLDLELLGLTVGGANLLPVKIDATAEYLPLSDFAAWANPFSMANNLAAAMFPTYVLRNQSIPGVLEDLTEQVVEQLVAGLPDDLGEGPALNIYYTLDAQSLPLLEPTYLAVDVINLLTGANFNNPLGTALTPVLTSLVNLGYTDVEYNEETGLYERDFDEAGVATAFGTLPADVDWAQVPRHLMNNLVTGIQQAFDDGLINENPVPNPIQTLLGLLGAGGVTDGLGTGRVITLNVPADGDAEPGVRTLAAVAGEESGTAPDDGAPELVDSTPKKVAAQAADADEKVTVVADNGRSQTRTTTERLATRMDSTASDAGQDVKKPTQNVKRGNDAKDVKKAKDAKGPKHAKKTKRSDKSAKKQAKKKAAA